MEKQAENEKPSRNPEGAKKRTRLVITVLVVLGLIGAGAGIWYYLDTLKYVYSENASIGAPLIQLTAKTGGVLKEVLVYEGEVVGARQAVARVGDEMIRTEIAGKVIMAKQDIGAVYGPGVPVVTMIDPGAMRVVAKIEEDKGLKDVHPMQKVYFTVDAYGSQKFEGFVEEVSQMSSSGDVVFNISDKRQEQDFEVKIRYDRKNLPVFENGMSAKVWIVK